MIWQHPLAFPLAVTALGLLVAALAIGWPLDRGENHDDRRHRDFA